MGKTRLATWEYGLLGEAVPPEVAADVAMMEAANRAAELELATDPEEGTCTSST